MLLLLLLLRRLLGLRLMVRHGCMVITVHAWLLLLLLLLRRGLLLDFRGVLVVQRRVQEIVGTHGGDGQAARLLAADGRDGAARLSDVDVAGGG